eukprot:TRINITY_DN30934_c0_g1_i1.p1 TRINITY_DN30934_c0_g1~~TRINITY_DN30934_c0_g1_i1.p1  ORF type:complete len:134 (-),score=13.15 TRINITY_DN30934_c0_g1_i1:9-410(-)
MLTQESRGWKQRHSHSASISLGIETSQNHTRIFQSTQRPQKQQLPTLQIQCKLIHRQNSKNINNKIFSNFKLPKDRSARNGSVKIPNFFVNLNRYGNGCSMGVGGGFVFMGLAPVGLAMPPPKLNSDLLSSGE